MDIRTNHILEIIENVGIFVAGAILTMLACIKYGPFWIKAFRETANVREATAMTILRRHIDQLNESLARKEQVIEDLVTWQHRHKKKIEEQYKNILALRQEIQELEVRRNEDNPANQKDR